MLKEFLLVLTIVVGVMFIFAGIYLTIDRIQCFAKTDGMAFDARWSVFGGCQIEVQENNWIPLESYYFKQE